MDFGSEEKESFFKYSFIIFIYLLAVPGLNCNTWDLLCCGNAGSLVAAYELFTVADGIHFPNQG